MAKNSPQDIKNREYFSDNLNRIMKEKGVRQIDLHNNTDIPKSTITGYVKGKSLPTPGNLQKIADFLNVKKSDLDLRFNLREENPQIKLIDSWLNGLMELSNIESSVTENG
ncbi:TPA: helix-turn-helix domain-containing protein, partial [Streptococcus agalactiae]